MSHGLDNSAERGRTGPGDGRCRELTRRSAWRRYAAVAGACAVAAGAFGAAPAGAADAVLHVDGSSATCSSAGPGTTDAPFCTIGDAAAQAGPGTTVSVESGTYVEQVKPPSGASGSPVVFTAAPGATVVVTGAPHAFRLSDRSWVTIKGFTITGTSDDAIYALNGSNLAIAGNRISDVGGSGIQLNATTDSRIEDNTIARTADHGIYLPCQPTATACAGSNRDRVAGNAVSLSGRPDSFAAAPGAAGIRIYVGADNTVLANVTRDNADSGIDVYGATGNTVAENVVVGNGDHGIDVDAAGGTRVLGNTVARNQTIAVNLGYSPNATVADNIIDTTGAASAYTVSALRVQGESVPGTTVDYDLLNGPAGRLVEWNYRSYSSIAELTAATGQEAHGIQADPGFAGPAAGDVTLTPGSPAVDSALSGLAGLPATDAFGSARVDDRGTPDSGAGTRTFDDRGAYELRNPGFETDLSGWNASGSTTGVLLERVTDAHTGAGAVALTNGASTSGTCVLNDSPNRIARTAAGTYTASVWVRGATPGAVLKLRLREWLGQTALGMARASVVLTGGWQRVSVDYAARAPGASTIDMNAYVTQAAPGACMIADDASVTLR